MKRYLAITAALALVLTACGDKSRHPARWLTPSLWRT